MLEEHDENPETRLGAQIRYRLGGSYSEKCTYGLHRKTNNRVRVGTCDCGGDHNDVEDGRRFYSFVKILEEAEECTGW